MTYKEYGINKSLIQSNVMYSKLPKNANMYMYFIVKSISLLKKNGQLVVIFPEVGKRVVQGKIYKKKLIIPVALLKSLMFMEMYLKITF